jgi:hypothetical protein
MTKKMCSHRCYRFEHLSVEVFPEAEAKENINVALLIG